jgi:plastocyanin
MPLRRLMVCFVLPLALACGGSGGPSQPPVASVSLTAGSSGPLTSIGDTLQLTAVPRDASGAAIPGVGVLFTSSSNAAATVTQGGLVTAVANGTTTIHASAEGKEATLDVTVAQVVAQAIVTPASIRVPQGETPLFQASAVDARNHPVAGAPVPVWTTTDAAVATIGTDGRATVSASAGNGATVSAVATVGTVASTAGGLMTVDSTAVYVETITVTTTGATSFSKVNDTSQFSATATNPHGDVTSTVTFAWSSSVASVAGVSSTGLVTSVANGNAAISATSNGVSGSLGVTVSQVPASVSVSASGGGSSASLASLGATASLVGTAFDSGGSAIPGATFTWTSDATSIATVSSTGVVTAVNNGTAHVTARTSNQIASPAFTVTVQQVVASVSVLPATGSIPRCTTQQFSATPKDARGNLIASAPAPTWSSASTTVATVDGNGLATSVSTGGPVAIKATINGVIGSGQLTVNTSPIVVNWPGSAATNPVNVTTCQAQTIVWHNTDIYDHTATGLTGPPVTGDIPSGGNSVAQSFPSPGTYQYHCDFHPNETGTVTIQ